MLRRDQPAGEITGFRPILWAQPGQHAIELVVCRIIRREHLISQPLPFGNAVLGCPLRSCHGTAHACRKPTRWGGMVPLYPTGDKVSVDLSYPHQVCNHIPHLPLRTGAWPVPGVWREGVQVLFDAGRFRLEKRDAVCKCLHVFVPLYILTKNLSVPLTRAERIIEAVAAWAMHAKISAGRA